MAKGHQNGSDAGSAQAWRSNSTRSPPPLPFEQKRSPFVCYNSDDRPHFSSFVADNNSPSHLQRLAVLLDHRGQINQHCIYLCPKRSNVRREDSQKTSIFGDAHRRDHFSTLIIPNYKSSAVTVVNILGPNKCHKVDKVTNVLFNKRRLEKVLTSIKPRSRIRIQLL